MASCLLPTSQQGKTVATCTYCGFGELGQGLRCLTVIRHFGLGTPSFNPLSRGGQLRVTLPISSLGATIVVLLLNKAKYLRGFPFLGPFSS